MGKLDVVGGEMLWVGQVDLGLGEIFAGQLKVVEGGADRECRMIDDLDDLVKSAVSEVFDTMLSLEIRQEPPGSEIRNEGPHVAGAVGFSGKVCGVVYIYSSALLARRITCGMLGLEEAEIDGDEMVNDTVGEMTNMVVGQLKSRLCDRGAPCVLTVPSIVRGTNFTIEAVSSTSRRVLTFECAGDQQLVVEVLVKTATITE
jgi:chemotaxis protein CheX